jgi:hypothetical protein
MLTEDLSFSQLLSTNLVLFDTPSRENRFIKCFQNLISSLSEKEMTVEMIQFASILSETC